MLYRLLYYGFARHLPKSTMPVIGKMAFRLRQWCCRHMFASCGINLNVEQGAYVGRGKDFSVGNNVGIGKDFCSHNRIVTIDDHLLMGEDVLFLGGVMHSRTKTQLSDSKAIKIRHRYILQEMYGLVHVQSSFLVVNG